MDKAEVQAVSFRLVAHAGAASSLFGDAIGAARDGRFDDVDRLIEQGDAEIVAAHQTQTALLREEVSGEDMAFSLLLVHAQDHLMSTIMFERVAKELIEMYRRMAHAQ